MTISTKTLKRVAIATVILASALIVLALAMDAFFIAWLGWGMIFVAMELYALARKQPDDTLSEQVWLGTRSKSMVWSLVWKTTVGAIVAWLFAHFLFGL